MVTISLPATDRGFSRRKVLNGLEAGGWGGILPKNKSGIMKEELTLSSRQLAVTIIGCGYNIMYKLLFLHRFLLMS